MFDGISSKQILFVCRSFLGLRRRNLFLGCFFQLKKKAKFSFFDWIKILWSNFFSKRGKKSSHVSKTFYWQFLVKDVSLVILYSSTGIWRRIWRNTEMKHWILNFTHNWNTSVLRFELKFWQMDFCKSLMKMVLPQTDFWVFHSFSKAGTLRQNLNLESLKLEFDGSVKKKRKRWIKRFKEIDSKRTFECKFLSRKQALWDGVWNSSSWN